MSQKFVAVTEIAHNCPVCDGKDYLGLEWFDSPGDIIEWLAEQTPHNVFIKDIWDQGAHERSGYSVTYEEVRLGNVGRQGHHGIIAATLLLDKHIVATVSRPPYEDNREWTIEMREE